MNKIFTLQQGNSPLLISVPHAGEYIPDDIAAQMSKTGKKIYDTDWYVDKLYPFAKKLGASLLCATHSRYVVDLNRAPDDTDLYPGQVKTGLCPMQSFDGEDIYKDDVSLGEADIKQRVEIYWRPYHNALEKELNRKKEQHGYALLFDAHSIRSEVSRLFDGRLPDLNLGTNYGQTCALGIEAQVFATAQKSDYESVLNGRFVGGHITRHYGQPSSDIHAIQMELIWDLYMNEATLEFDRYKAKKLSNTLHDILISYSDAGANHYK